MKIVIIGGGVIGLAIGWRLARAGENVTVFDRSAAGKGASWVAGGMLGPEFEVGYEEPEFLEFGQYSLSRYPEFLEELYQDSKMTVPLRKEGTLVVAMDRDEAERLKVFFDFRMQLGFPIRWLHALQVRELEPLLSPRTVAAVSIPDDLQTDPRELIRALCKAFITCGGKIEENMRVREVSVEDGKITGVITEDDFMAADIVLLAAGSWSSQITGIPSPLLPPVRPVKGQTIRLQMPESPRISHVIRGFEAYLIPKDDGTLIVGATSEEMGYDRSLTTGPIMELLQGAYELAPTVYDYTIQEMGVGLRPGTRDNRPILGESSISGLYYATGHYRNGILLTPATAYEMTTLILHGSSRHLAPFSPSRFVQQEVVA